MSTPQERAAQRDKARADGYDPEALEDDDILTDADIDELVESVPRWLGDREGGPSEPRAIEDFEVVVSRTEYVVLIRELDRRRKRVAELEALLRKSMGLMDGVKVENDSIHYDSKISTATRAQIICCRQDIEKALRGEGAE